MLIRLAFLFLVLPDSTRRLFLKYLGLHFCTNSEQGTVVEIKVKTYFDLQQNESHLAQNLEFSANPDFGVDLHFQ